jgi:hypothetical protein
MVPPDMSRVAATGTGPGQEEGMTMPRITDAAVADVNERIARAVTTKQAFDLLATLSRTMVDRLLDLNGQDMAEMHGCGLAVRCEQVAAAHGWDWNERDDDVPADGRGPDGCSLRRFERHSRRPLECRACGRRKIDHRPADS